MRIWAKASVSACVPSWSSTKEPHDSSVPSTVIALAILSVALMLVAATGVLPAILGALSQEVVDLLAILNALRALRGPRREP